MANFNYRRFFIILRAKDAGFELHDREPSGYCKIDIKNNRIKFFIYAQDLKPQTSEQGIYEAYIVSPREEKSAQKLTDVFVDNRGRAECTVESDTETLKRTAKSLEEFSSIAVIFRSSTQAGKLYFPLVGSAGKRAELDWSGRIMADILKVSGKDINEQQIPDKSEIQRNAKLEKAAATEKSVPKEASELENATHELKAAFIDGDVLNQNDLPMSNDLCVHRDIEQNAAKEIPEIAADQTVLDDGLNDLGCELGVSDEENLQREKNDFFESIENEECSISDTAVFETGGLFEENACDKDFISDKPHHEGTIIEKIETHDKTTFVDDKNTDDKTGEEGCSQVSSSTYWDVMRDYFMKIYKENSRVYPFGYNDNRKWVKVEHIPDGYSEYCNQRAYMSFHSADPLRRDPISLSHYLVGVIDEDEKTSHVIYGFPGYSYEQPPAYAIHGIAVWEPLKNGYGKGYWLIYIDAQTGDLVQRP